VTLELPETLLGGIAVTAGTTDEASATFCNLEISEPAPYFRRGDCNADGEVDIADGVSSLNFLFLAGGAPPCLDSADSDDSGAIDISDSVAVFNYLFLEGDMPPAPGPRECGADPTPDELGCGGFAGCP
jgi:hypothetical protein